MAEIADLMIDLKADTSRMCSPLQAERTLLNNWSGNACGCLRKWSRQLELSSAS